MAKPATLFIVATFIQCLASIIALICELVLGVDIAIVVNAQTSSPESLNPYNGWIDYSYFDQYPWYPPIGMNGLYLNLATGIFSFLSIIGILIKWKCRYRRDALIIVGFVNWGLLTASSVFMVVVNGALFPCLVDSLVIWYCVLPDIATALDMLLWILWFVTIVAGIWHISPPDPDEPHIVNTLSVILAFKIAWKRSVHISLRVLEGANQAAKRADAQLGL